MSQAPSGKFVLRVPPSLHRRLRQMAEAHGLSLNALCVRLLSSATGTGSSPAPGVLPGGEAAWPPLAQRYADAYGGELLGMVLFGSTARGEARPASDIDLLLVLAPETPLRRHLYRQWDELVADSGIEYQLNPHFVHLPETIDQAGSIWLEVAIEGRLISDRQGRIWPVLLALRHAIAAGRFVRSTVHGQPYWRRAA
jgi:hypothetical protein